MINPDNVINISGRLVRDPELVMDGKQASFSIAIDNSGYEKGSDSRAGFFNCRMWLTPSDMSAVASVNDVKEAIETGRLSKGVAVRIVGSVHQNRYIDKDENRRNDVQIMVEQMSIFAAKNKTDAQSENTNVATAGSDYEPF